MAWRDVDDDENVLICEGWVDPLPGTEIGYTCAVALVQYGYVDTLRDAWELLIDQATVQHVVSNKHGPITAVFW